MKSLELTILLLILTFAKAQAGHLSSVSQLDTSVPKITIAPVEERSSNSSAEEFKFSRKALSSLQAMPQINLRKDYGFKDESQLNTNIASEGGGVNGGGGGGGVLCYPQGQAHDQKSFYLAVIFEAWDWTHITTDVFNRIGKETHFGQYFAVEPRNISYENYLKTIVYGQWGFRFRFVNPLFAKILIQTIDEVLSQTHQCREFSNYTDDRGRIFTNEIEWMKANNCSPVQLAWRSSVEGNPYQSKIEFNCKLFDRLGVKGGHDSFKTVNQALLILHEALYLMGSRLSTHPTSENIRRLINIIMTPSGLNDNSIYKSSDSRRLFRQLKFDDYFKLYKTDLVKDKLKISRQQSYRSAVKIIGNLRRLFLPFPKGLNAQDSLFFTDPDRIFAWVLKNDPVYNFYHSDQIEIKNARLLFSKAIVEYGIPIMSDEEAFLFAASIYSNWADLDYKYDVNATFEHLLTPGEDDAKILKAICEYKYRYNNQLWNALKPKLELYCQKMKDQNEMTIKLQSTLGDK